ncbi:hypothetical protein CC2G_006448 [Coprinopsis cinerea AmutBmut pab1-1]|nr:hypothetical protein CC2G_006448 [Coprinopsis cinerea AmutBmut pab1-1]
MSSPSSKPTSSKPARPKYVWVAAPGSVRLPPVPRRIPAVYSSATPASASTSTTASESIEPPIVNSSDSNNDSSVGEDPESEGSSLPEPPGWDPESVFYVPIPTPADRDARTQVVRTLVMKLMTLPTRHDYLRFALYRVTMQFLADLSGIWLRDPDTGVVDRSKPTSLDVVFRAWKAEANKALGDYRWSWPGIKDEMQAISKEIYRALDAERNGESTTQRGPEEGFKKGFRVRALAGIPTRVPVEYGSDGRLHWCGYVFEELSMSSITYEVISGCLVDVCEELGPGNIRGRIKTSQK